MSIHGNYQGGLERPFPIRLTSTAATDITTSTDNNIAISTIALANETGGAVDVKCFYHNGTTDFLIFRRSVPAADTVIVCDVPLRLRSGDKLKIQAATADAITATAIVLRSQPNEAAYAANPLSISPRNR